MRNRIGFGIRWARERQVIGQTEFARMMNVHRTTVFRVESGAQEVAFDFVVQAAEALGMSVDDLRRGCIAERWSSLESRQRSKLKRKFLHDVQLLEHGECPSEEFVSAVAAELQLSEVECLYGLLPEPVS